MALLTTLALAGGVLAASAAVRRKTPSVRLVDVLINGEPKSATLLPPAT